MSTSIFNEHADMALNLIDLERYPIGDLDQGEGALFLK
jgi:hypothetical protein